MKKAFFLFLAAALIAGCAASKKSIPQDQKNGAKGTYDESFDPLSLKDDDIVIGEKQAPGKDLKNEIREEDTEPPEDIPLTESDGFRVQLLATKSYESATLAQQKAADQFGTMDHEAYIIFNAPQYKVRVGDVITRSQAEDIRDIARDYGYKGAFIVRSKVLVKQKEE